MTLRALRRAALVAVFLLVAGCAGESSLRTPDVTPSTNVPQGDGERSTGTALADGLQQVEAGVVVAVDGTLAAIDSFSVLLGDGSSILLIPRSGLMFDNGPLAHLRDHLVSGSPIAVVFHQEGDKLIATEVGDAE